MNRSILKRTILSSGLALLLANNAMATDLSGTRFVVSNLFKGNSTNQLEVDVTQFGLTNNLFSTVGDGVELPNFITLYDIDLSENSVSFDWVESGFSKKVGGVMPDDKHDRNYFMFDLPEGKEIVAVEFAHDQSSLHEGSELPTATLIAPNKFMTEFAAGVIRKEGFRPAFKIKLN